MKKLSFLLSLSLAFVLFLSSCTTTKQNDEKLSVPYVQYQLDNGLDVILHQDKSDPIVAVAIMYHVGSNREVPGKTGFAHLFEHMMFQQSENVGQDEFFSKIQSAGGTLNGGTGNDQTIYYEVVPKNALEMVLWLESDRMGYLENTVTKAAFANQQNVVQNEKRQSYDNRPYGFNQWVIAKNLYPAGHPYNWTVIGEMEDLFNASVDDVKAFHSKFYVPNNTTIVLAGDFEEADVKPMLEKYFGEIPGGEKVEDMQPQNVTLDETKKLYHEDNFARTPQLTMIWPTVEQYNEDAYALQFLGQVLGTGKKSPFYRVIVKDKKLAPRASVYSRTMELTGQFTISVNANAGTSLAEVENAVFEAFQLFEEEGITEKDLEKHKAGLETQFYNGVSSVLSKSFQLALYNEFTGSPGYIEEDIAKIQAVTIDDINRVYEKYVKGKNYLATSFVPKGQLDLVAENSVDAGIVEENILEATQVDQSAIAADEEIAKTPTKFDRSVEPAKGPDPEISVPEVWTDETANGIKVYGIEHNELPLVRYSIVIDGGHILAETDKAGVASFMASMLMEGTATKTPEELEEEIDLLGANINVRAGTENISVSVNSLTRNYEKTLALVEEILLEPRWDEEQFELVKLRMINNVKRNQANPNYLASVAFDKLVYGDDNILALPSSGTIESLESITMDDLKDFYNKAVSPSVARMHVVGKIDHDRVVAGLASLSANWEAHDVVFPEIAAPKLPEKSTIYFVDVPGAKQSVINIGQNAIPRTSDDFEKATVMNYKLGGSFNGNVNMILREEKGFTYGARTYFSGGKNYGTFQASSSVRTTATEESVQIFKDEIKKYREGISDDDLQFTKDALIKSNARGFETLGALHAMLTNISAYDLPFDYVKQEEEFIKSLTPEQHKELAQKLLDPEHMYYVVVGDAETQLAALKKIGLGDPILYEL
ncbi:pitrilysin family protein [Draconibacterium sp. IB214405]|uniref:M16 family metallopeptidase n=1 Tax=Draconibacterium sp. IB214405 TaxID=3097352 RepID=UPI002A0C5934|nr:pitrilysin family protein [Draconibacterium sp. IB214405]MDX8340881.1 pitrilysin family protein [Draconibacterium sp. IB214405]